MAYIATWLSVHNLVLSGFMKLQPFMNEFNDDVVFISRRRARKVSSVNDVTACWPARWYVEQRYQPTGNDVGVLGVTLGAYICGKQAKMMCCNWLVGVLVLLVGNAILTPERTRLVFLYYIISQTDTKASDDQHHDGCLNPIRKRP